MPMPTKRLGKIRHRQTLTARPHKQFCACSISCHSPFISSGSTYRTEQQPIKSPRWVASQIVCTVSVFVTSPPTLKFQSRLSSNWIYALVLYDRSTRQCTRMRIYLAAQHHFFFLRPDFTVLSLIELIASLEASNPSDSSLMTSLLRSLSSSLRNS